jgi:hypothetical protein
MMKFLILSFTMLSCLAFGQGKVTGVINDGLTGEPIPFAKVKVEGQNKGAVSDFDGLFGFSIEAGKYTIVYTVAEYESITKEIVVIEGKTIEANVSLIKKVQEIKGDFTVVAYRQTAKSIAGDDVRRMTASASTDGMTKEQMRATGDGDAGEAIQRVPGVSVQGGKHVFVRGLGDRYTKTILNGIEIPGLDPDRNTVQLDIFPTAVIDNITVYKTFTPDLSGDFTGGLVDVITREFPNKKEMNFSFGTGYNSSTTFKNNFLVANGGRIDYIGFDDGTRSMPLPPTTKIPDVSLGSDELTKMTRSFNSVMAPTQSTALMNHNYGFSMGNQFKDILKKDNLDYGYSFALNYDNSNSFKENMSFGEYRKSQNLKETELEAYRLSQGNIASQNVMWTGLFGQTLKINDKSKLGMTLFHTQNGESTASSIRESNIVNNPSKLVKQGLQYTQRQVTNLDLNGNHKFKTGKLTWNVSPTLSKIQDPDMRSTVLEEVEIIDGEGNSFLHYELNPSVGAEIRRAFRTLNEKNINTKVNYSFEFMQWDSLQSEIKIGASNVIKQRDFKVTSYDFLLAGSKVGESDPNYYFKEENLYTPERGVGTYVRSSDQPANSYEGSQMISAVYAMHELPLTSKLKATYGARVEQAQNHYTGQNNSGTVVYQNEKVLDELNVLPSVNLMYSLKNLVDDSKSNTNFRTSFATTVARPSFREKSIAQIYDPILGRTFNGNIDLKQTTIHNADFRWEHFYGRTELISASAFYKKFINPIEIASFEQAPNEVQPVNSGEAEVFGFELEARKSIGYKNEGQEHLKFTVGANYNYVVSKVDMTKVMIEKGGQEFSEYELRANNLRGDETAKRFRPMYGQSPYAVNAFVTWANTKSGMNFNMSYNVQGSRLSVIGVGMISDVYEQAFHSLNLKASKAFGENKAWVASLSGSNLLNNKREHLYQSYNAQKQIYSSFSPGMSVSAGIAYSIK